MTIRSDESLLRFWAPRYWPLWTAFGLMWCVSRLPYRWQTAIGTRLGRLLRLIARERCHVARVNLKLCFPELDEAQREQLLRAHFESLGMMLVEMSLTWWAPPERLLRLVRVEGLEHVLKVLHEGRGVIVLAPHFTTQELGGHVLDLYQSGDAMYRPNENPLIAAMMHRGRRKFGDERILHTDVRAMLRRLKAGRAVWYAPDQSFRRKGSIMVPWFGVPAPTNSATARIAAISGAPVISYYTHRLEDGSGYKVVVQPPIADFPSGDVEKDTLRINQIIEAQIRKQPAEYWWVHKRFKRRRVTGINIYRKGAEV